VDYSDYQRLFDRIITVDFHAAGDHIAESYWMMLSEVTQRQVIDRLRQELHESGVIELD